MVSQRNPFALSHQSYQWSFEQVGFNTEWGVMLQEY